MTINLSFVDFGGCNRDDGDYDRLDQFSCALEPLDCKAAHSTFVSPDKITVFDHYTCNSVSSFRTGRCSDSKICAKSEHSCRDKSTFLSEKIKDRRCTIRMDEISGKAALYTACLSDTYKGGKLCVITSEECEINSQEVIYHDELCDCFMTRTGACVEDFNFATKYYCAVSSQSCGDGMTFRTAHELFDDGSHDCRLCEAEDVAFREISMSITSSIDNPRKDIIAGIIFGVVGTCVIVLGIAIWRRRITSKESITTTNAKLSSIGEPMKKADII